MHFNSFDFDFLSKAEKTDKMTYLRNKRHYIDNLIQVEEGLGNMTFNDIEERNRHLKFRAGVARRNNNWIEVYP